MALIRRRVTMPIALPCSSGFDTSRAPALREFARQIAAYSALWPAQGAQFARNISRKEPRLHRRLLTTEAVKSLKTQDRFPVRFRNEAETWDDDLPDFLDGPERGA
jgi:hypothetical protein